MAFTKRLIVVARENKDQKLSFGNDYPPQLTETYRNLLKLRKDSIIAGQRCRIQQTNTNPFLILKKLLPNSSKLSTDLSQASASMDTLLPLNKDYITNRKSKR